MKQQASFVGYTFRYIFVVSYSLVLLVYPSKFGRKTSTSRLPASRIYLRIIIKYIYYYFFFLLTVVLCVCKPNDGPINTVGKQT